MCACAGVAYQQVHDVTASAVRVCTQDIMDNPRRTAVGANVGVAVVGAEVFIIGAEGVPVVPVCCMCAPNLFVTPI